MNVGLSIMVMLLAITISTIPAYGATFQGKILESDSVTIKFGTDVIDYKGNIMPLIEKVELKLNSDSILVKNPVFRMMGSSFVIKSFEDNIIIYGINKGSSFNFHTLIFTDNNQIKINDNAQFSTAEIIQEQTAQKTNNLHILVQSSLTTFNAQDFNFDIKAFDKLQYSGNNFQNFFGKIDGVKITAITKSPEGKVLNNQTGITKYGLYEGKIHVPANLWPSGWYAIEISADGDIGSVQKTIKFYVAGQTPPKGGSNAP